MPDNKSIFGTPGTITIKGQEFILPQPTSGDQGRVYERMRELAAKACVSPLAYVNANAEGMNPVVLAEAVRAAIAIGSGGGVEPTREAVLRTYETLDGLRFRVWYFARKAKPGLLLEDVAALVNEDDRYDVADALAKAQPAPEAAGPLAPPSGER